MPGELGNEEMQQNVGYYERRYSPDLKINEDTMEEMLQRHQKMRQEKNEKIKKKEMRNRVSTSSLLRVMRDYGESEDKEKKSCQISHQK